jgi:hypothetical protein
MRPDPPGCEAQGGPGLIIRPAATVGADDQPSNAGGLPLVWFHQSGQVKKYPLNCGEPEMTRDMVEASVSCARFSARLCTLPFNRSVSSAAGTGRVGNAILLLLALSSFFLRREREL